MESIFSAQLQKLRKEAGVKQETLAVSLGVSPQAVSKWENGSYPDGDLLPKIADFFGVSIDYLYGRTEKEVTVEQRIIDELQKLAVTDEEQTNDFEQMMRYMWSMLISASQTDNYYYERDIIDNSEYVCAAEITDSSGFCFMRLNKDLEYSFLVKQPKDGFAKRLKITDDMAELFKFLGDKINLKILYYMLSLDNKEVVRSKTIAKLLDISVERVEQALNYLCSFNGIFTDGTIVDENNQNENIYRAYWAKTIEPIMLLICADLIIKSPAGYQNQIAWRPEAWFCRKDLNFLNNDNIN